MVLAIGARLLPGARTIDDAYITFRYARSILAGSGFVYNPGDKVLGTTTPLYTLTMTVLGALTGGPNAPFPDISLVVNAFADALTSFLLWRIGKQLKFESAGLLAAAAWAVAPFSVTFSIGGMETSVYILSLVGLIWSYLGKRMVWCGVTASLAFLTRPDALILIGLIGMDVLLEMIKKRTPAGAWKGPAIFLLISGMWLGFAWWYFGSPLPHSMMAKSLAYRLNPEDGLIRLIQHYADPFMDENTFGPASIWYGIFLYPFLFIVGGMAALRKNATSHLWVWFPWVYFMVFAFFNPLLFRWYLSPPLPVYFLMIFIGGIVILEAVLAQLKTSQSWSRGLKMALCALPLLLLINAWTFRPDHANQRPAPEMAFIKLELLYRDAAETIIPSLKPGDVVAAGDVGVLGYFTGATILDTVGLNSPIASRYYPADSRIYAINYAIPANLILDQRPEYVVILEVYGRRGLVNEPSFINQYDRIAKIPTDMYGSDGLLIYRRQTVESEMKG